MTNLPKKTPAWIALGSNLGDRLGLLRLALKALSEHPRIEIVKCSRVYETEPVGGRSGQNSYLNAVASMNTAIPPHRLLMSLLAIEQGFGRVQTEVRDEPRCVDLDLLAWGDFVCEDEKLVLPHPRLHQRSFVLEPLSEIAPGWIHPRLGLQARELADSVRGTSWIRIVEGEKLWP